MKETPCRSEEKKKKKEKGELLYRLFMEIFSFTRKSAVHPPSYKDGIINKVIGNLYEFFFPLEFNKFTILLGNSDRIKLLCIDLVA